MNNTMMSGNERKRLANEINVLDFTLTELRQYLNTHPNDRDAISYYQKYANMLRQAVSDYTMKYGVICHDIPGQCMDEWKWATEPMPWEGGNC